METKTASQQLLERVTYWETELDFELSPHPEPAQRLDTMIESLIDENSAFMERLDTRNTEVARLNQLVGTLRKVIADQNESMGQYRTENNRLRRRWTSLRALLGISSRHEDSWE